LIGSENMKIKCVINKEINIERVLLGLELIKSRKEVVDKVREYVKIWAENRLTTIGWCEPNELIGVLRSVLIGEGYVKLQ
jgi:hypothetical protein